MAEITTKGYQYPDEDDAVTVYPALAALMGLLHDARPGVSPVSTATRDGYAGIDLWTGRVIFNTDNDRLEWYNGSGWGPTTKITVYTDTTRDALAAPELFAGRLIYNSTSGTLEIYTGGVWVPVSFSVPTYTQIQRVALAGEDLWPGMIVWDSTVSSLFLYESGVWIQVTPSYVTNAITLGTAAAPGSEAGLIRPDAVIAAFNDADVPTLIVPGAVAGEGVDNFASRVDHRHGMSMSPVSGFLAAPMTIESVSRRTITCLITSASNILRVPSTTPETNFTCTSAAGSPIISALAGFANVVPGTTAVAVGFLPSGTTVLHVNSDTSITLSAPAISSASPFPIIFGSVYNDNFMTSGGPNIGDHVYCPGYIPPGTTVVSIDSTGQITVSNPSIASGTQPVDFYQTNVVMTTSVLAAGIWVVNAQIASDGMQGAMAFVPHVSATFLGPSGTLQYIAFVAAMQAMISLASSGAVDIVFYPVGGTGATIVPDTVTGGGLTIVSSLVRHPTSWNAYKIG